MSVAAATVNYSELARALLPEAALTLGALTVLTLDLTVGKSRSALARSKLAACIGLLALIAAVAGAFEAGLGGAAFGDALILDSLTLATRIGVFGLAALTLALVPGTTRIADVAEYVAVILFATAGFSLMAAANQLLLAFLALELASLSLYVLVAFDKARAEAAEAALKYFLVGGISAAFLLFGFSLLYGLTGAITFPEIAAQLRGLPLTPLLFVALAMTLVAFGFKAAAAPFHLWAPDAYQGAPASSAALIASASKLAGFVLLLRLLWSAAPYAAGSIGSFNSAPGWLPVLALLSGASLLIGNLGALAQRNVRRLLAYSAIAHAGSLLIGVMVARLTGPGPLFYYALTYGIATVGAFGVVAMVQRAGRCQDLTDLAGLSRRSPLLAACLLVFILSLAGIPPLAGFFGKFAVFAAAVRMGGVAGFLGLLVIAAILFSAVGLYYYLLILKQAFVSPPSPSSNTQRISVPRGTATALVVAAVALLLFGLNPSLLLELFP